MSAFEPLQRVHVKWTDALGQTLTLDGFLLHPEQEGFWRVNVGGMAIVAPEGDITDAEVPQGT
jgi:hypothetical protein